MATTLGCDVPYTKNGPFFRLADGNQMLQHIGMQIRKAHRSDLRPGGKYVGMVATS